MSLELAIVDRLAELVLAGVARPYPYKSGLVWSSVASVLPHTEVHPSFYGCFDWHSAVHSHWTLARLSRQYPDQPWAGAARDRLAEHLTTQRLQREYATLSAHPSFELPYGLAWLLTLDAELAHHPPEWRASLAPLTELARERLAAWFQSLTLPIRSGQHDQSAFAMTLAVRWSRSTRHPWDQDIARIALALHESDRRTPLHLEPSAHDFLSPSLGVAELMAEVMPADRFSDWLKGWAPELGRGWPEAPVRCHDRADGKLAHFEGLNLSRSWMLSAIAEALPANDPRARALRDSAHEHRHLGLQALTSDEYAVTHWLPTFALYRAC